MGYYQWDSLNGNIFENDANLHIRLNLYNSWDATVTPLSPNKFKLEISSLIGNWTINDSNEFYLGDGNLAFTATGTIDRIPGTVSDNTFDVLPIIYEEVTPGNWVEVQTDLIPYTVSIGPIYKYRYDYSEFGFTEVYDKSLDFRTQLDQYPFIWEGSPTRVYTANSYIHGVDSNYIDGPDGPTYNLVSTETKPLPCSNLTLNNPVLLNNFVSKLDNDIPTLFATHEFSLVPVAQSAVQSYFNTYPIDGYMRFVYGNCTMSKGTYSTPAPWLEVLYMNRNLITTPHSSTVNLVVGERKSFQFAMKPGKKITVSVAITSYNVVLYAIDRHGVENGTNGSYTFVPDGSTNEVAFYIMNNTAGSTSTTLTITEADMTPVTITPITSGQLLTGTLSNSLGLDEYTNQPAVSYSIDLVGGQRLTTLETVANGEACAIIRNSNGVLMAEDWGANITGFQAVTAGTYYITIMANSTYRGNYSLTATVA